MHWVAWIASTWHLYNASSELADLLAVALLALAFLGVAALVVADRLERVAVVMIIPDGVSDV
jgi:predicted HAD superfamily Cof-like phosphohydrolase